MNEQQVKEFINIIVASLQQNNVPGAHIPVEFTPELLEDADSLPAQLDSIIQHGRSCGLRFYSMAPSIKPSSYQILFNNLA